MTNSIAVQWCARRLSNCFCVYCAGGDGAAAGDGDGLAPPCVWLGPMALDARSGVVQHAVAAAMPTALAHQLGFQSKRHRKAPTKESQAFFAGQVGRVFLGSARG